MWKEDYAQVGENFRTGEAGRRKTEYQDLTPKVYAVSRIIGAKQRSEHSQAEPGEVFAAGEEAGYFFVETTPAS